MKILNTIQELWAYCLFCPICQDSVRTIYVDVGPDDTFQLSNFKKDNHILKLDCAFRAKKQIYNIDYCINCLDNSFTVDIHEPKPITDNSRVDKASAPYFYFYIHSACRECDTTHTNSNDLEIELLTSKITNIGMETEDVYLCGDKYNFHIATSYSENEMLISKFKEDPFNGEFVNDDKPCQLPIIDFDYSSPKKVINKIKTLLVFS